MIAMLEYRRDASDKDKLIGSVTVRHDLGSDALQTYDFNLALLGDALSVLSRVVKANNIHGVYFRRLEQPDALPAPMLAEDVELMHTDPDALVRKLCNPEPVVIDLRAGKGKD